MFPYQNTSLQIHLIHDCQIYSDVTLIYVNGYANIRMSSIKTAHWFQTNLISFSLETPQSIQIFHRYPNLLLRVCNRLPVIIKQPKFPFANRIRKLSKSEFRA